MTDYPDNPATDISQAPLTKVPFDSAALKPGDDLRPIISRLPAVRTVYTALSGHLGRPLNVLSLDGDPDRFISFFVSDPAPAGSDRCDLLICAVPQHTGDNPDGTALLDIAGACADTVGVVLFEAVWDDRTAERRDIPPDDLRRLRQDFAFVHAVCEYDGDGGPGRRVLLFCSNRFWYANGHLGAFGSWTPYAHDMAEDTRLRTRRYFFSADRVAKSYCFYGPPARDNRHDIGREILFLSNPPVEGQSIPHLVARHVGGHDGVLVMERLPGIPLSTAIEQEKGYDPGLVLHDVLDGLDALERVGLYHNDVTPSNVLINSDGRTALIDFASITAKRRSLWLTGDPILCFFLFAQCVIYKRLLSLPISLFPIHPFGFPRQYRRWAALVWAHAPEQRDFALLKTCLEMALDSRPLRRRRHGFTGKLLRSYRRFSYGRALIAVQMRFFVERLRAATIRGVIRRVFASAARPFTARPIASITPTIQRCPQD
jgi:hypothetical protein